MSSEDSQSKSAKLTNKQKAFVREYLRDFNASRAARDAGYSEKTAYSIGQENLKKPVIAQAIQEGIAEKSMGVDEVLIRLAEHARGDMADFLDIGPMGFTVDIEKAQKKGLTHLLKKVKLRTTTSMNGAGVETETHDMEIELYSAQSALTLLAKQLGIMIERQDITSAGQPIKAYIGVSPDDWDSDTSAE